MTGAGKETENGNSASANAKRKGRENVKGNAKERGSVNAIGNENARRKRKEIEIGNTEIGKEIEWIS